MASSRSSGAQSERGEPLSKASCSSSLKRDVEEFGWSLAVFEAFRNHTEGQRLYTSDGFIAVGPVTHHASQGRHLGEPAAIVLAFYLDRKNHGPWSSCAVRG